MSDAIQNSVRSIVQLSFFPLKQNGHKLLALGKKVSHFLQHHFSAECNLENENPFSRKSHFFFYWPAVQQQLTMGTVKSQTMHVMSIALLLQDITKSGAGKCCKRRTARQGVLPSEIDGFSQLQTVIEQVVSKKCRLNGKN